MRECAAQVDVDRVGEFAVTIRKAIVAVGGNARWILHSLTHLTGNRHAYGQIHIIYVVHLCGDAKGRFSTREAHHTVGQETVVGAHASPYVSHQTLLVLLFQPHIHHVLAVAHVAPHHFRVLAVAVEHLHLIDGIGRQILQGCLGVAGKEVFAIDEQTLNTSSVHFDFAITVQFCPRELCNQRIEHRAFSQFEGVGIEHDGVALHHHLDFRASNHHFVEQFRFGIHLQDVQVGLNLTVRLDFKWSVEGLISHRGEPKNELTPARKRYRCSPLTEKAGGVFLHHDGFQHSTVGRHHRGGIVPDG